MALPTPTKKERNDKIIKMHKAGFTYERIGKRWNISKQRVYSIIKQQKLTQINFID